LDARTERRSAILVFGGHARAIGRACVVGALHGSCWVARVCCGGALNLEWVAY